METTNIYDVIQVVVVIVFLLVLFAMAIRYHIIEARYNATEEGFKVFRERQVTERVRLISRSRRPRNKELYNKFQFQDELTTLMNLYSHMEKEDHNV